MLDRRTLFAKSAALAAAGVLAAPSRLIAADEAADPYLQFVHPELRDVTAKLMKFMGREPKPLTLATLADQRKGMAGFARPRRADVPVDRKMIPGARGQPDVAIYIVNARPGEARPAILDTHGGGYVLGTADGDITDLQNLCAELGCVAVSVDYRLAPETSYAGSIEDNYAGLKWLHANAASIGGDPARIAVMGGSAGGGHAALLAIAARDRGEVPLVFQCLIYPMLDDRTGSTRQVPPHVGKIIWNATNNRFGWRSFTGAEPGSRSVPSAAVPARVADLKGLPPAFIGVGTIDLFHDEDVDYAQRLNAAGVATELVVVPGAFHGFDGIGLYDPKVKVSAWFNDAKKNALRRAFGLPVA